MPQEDIAVWSILNFWDCLIFLSTIGLTVLSVLYAAFVKKKYMQEKEMKQQKIPGLNIFSWEDN